MATFRSFSEIVSTMIQRLGFTQPNLDTKPGTVSRDLFVELPADQISRLYSALNFVSEKQSLATTTGRDLDRLASNFGATRNTGSSASGIIVFTTNNIVSDISIPTGTVITARNGARFRTIGNYVMTAADKNRLAANANRMRKALNIAGINSSYALEVPIQAIRPGTSGNLGSLQLIKSNLQAAASVINLSSTNGGSNGESDDSFRARILAIFSGANIGTAAGYRNSVLGVTGVLDALVVEPGDSLMLRDGTETLEIDDGTSRIISSGTGGKVDIYILGRKVEAVSESYIFTDLSGSGNIEDERNDYILGQSSQDQTRTSEERRVLAFKTGSLPVQPVDSMVSVVGSSSGLLTEAFTDANGIVYGNYELEKDLNPETGGSPFGFDSIHFVSNTKSVNAESMSKASNFSIDALSFTDINELTQVYRDVNEIGENSEISTAGTDYIRVLHTPVVRVSKVQNKTTGEIYSVVDQNIGSSGLNEDGLIQITGRTMPTSADILSVNYTWRDVYDSYIDYGGDGFGQFVDPSAADSIDWTSSGGIFEETTIISRSEDGLNYEVELDYDINKVISIYGKTTVESTISELSSSGASSVVGIELSTDDDVIGDIISIKRSSDSLELYNTKENNGSFSSRTIYLPTDSVGSIDDEITVHYNQIELFNIDKTDGSHYNKVAILPSEGILEAEEILETVETLYLSGDDIYAKYVINTQAIYPKVSLTGLPITGTDLLNTLSGLGGADSTASNQPIFYGYDDSLSIFEIQRFAPSKIKAQVSGISRPGKIKVAGTTMNRYIIDITAGVSMDGFQISLESELKELLSISSVPSNIGIAKIDKACLLDSDGEEYEVFDILGSELNNIDYSIGSAQEDSSLKNYEVTLPSTPNNTSISISSGDIMRVYVLVFNTDAYEELYFETSGIRTTENRFGRIERISVSSGFRSSAGNLVGSISLDSTNQPEAGKTYYVDYNFLAPKEGERITISYNVNKLIINSTLEAERVRPITADVLIKEAEEILIDVDGTLLINEDSLGDADKIVENVTNSVVNLLSTSKLGGIIDYSDIISVAAAESGVDSVNISLFNESGKTGRKAFIKALDNQSISAGTVSLEAVPRNKFRIN